MIRNGIVSFVVSLGLFQQTFANPMSAAVSTQKKLLIDIKNNQQSNIGSYAQTDASNCQCSNNGDLNVNNPNATFLSPISGNSTDPSGCCTYTNCVFVITAPQGYQVKVFSMMKFSNDNNASLTIRNGNGNGGFILGKLDINNTHGTFFSLVNAVTVTFSTHNIASSCDNNSTYLVFAELIQLPISPPASHLLSSSEPFLLIEHEDLSSSNQYLTVVAEPGKQVNLYLFGSLSNLNQAYIIIIDGTDIKGKLIAEISQLSSSTNGPLYAISSVSGSLTVLLKEETSSDSADLNFLFTQMDNDDSSAVNVNISNLGNGADSCPAVLITSLSPNPGMQMTVNSLQGSMVLYGGIDYQPSSNNEIISFFSMNDVISPMKVAGRIFLILIDPGSMINLNFETDYYLQVQKTTGESGGKGLMMSDNFPYSNTKEISNRYSFSGSGTDYYDLSVNVLHYDLGTAGNLTIKSTLSDSNFSKTLNNNGSNITMHFCANSFEVDYYSNGLGQQGFVLRYDVGSHWTSSPTTTSPPRFTIWISVAGGLLLFLILIAIFGFLWYRRRKQFITHLAQEHNSVGYGNRVELGEMYTDKGEVTKRYQYIDQPGTSHNERRSTRDAWEVSSDKLKIFNHEKLGSGAFCVVFKGKLEGEAPICKIQPSVVTQCFKNCEVAVKKLPEYADESSKNDFVQEIDFMKRIGYHLHLVNILGCITDPQLDPCLIIEYCCHGDLLKYVRNRRLEIVEPMVDDEKALRFKDLLSFAWQISDGMDFLSSKGCIHRDIAARNILVDENKVAKIGDFGLCRLMDTATYTTRGGRLPIKWMALESLQDYQYTTKSDVWSFGVLLYELFSLGAVPYSWVQPADMVDYLRSGKRLEKPEHCADNVYSIMQECWKDKPDERPFFSDLKMEFSTLLSCATEEYGYLDIGQPSDGQYRVVRKFGRHPLPYNCSRTLF
uniref:Protein kinase domain-containing protein n=1 Tax=Plectus sambesii TaxID=2011161 RepID=A0A914V1C6_9BILA